MPTKKATSRPKREAMRLRVWKCADLKLLIRKQIRAQVRDVEMAKRLEHALGDEIAYGTGGGGGVGVA